MTERSRRPGARAVLVLALLAVVALAAALPAIFAPREAAAAADYGPVHGTLTGPTDVGASLKGSYLVRATGGPAISLVNGSQIGTLSFSTNVVGTNTTNVQLLPTSGVLTNGSANLTLVTTNITQTLTLSVDVTSGYHGTNVSLNLTYTVDVVLPFVVSAQIVVDSTSGTMPFNLSVLLDGSPIGTVAVPALTAHQSYEVTFDYVNVGLSSGWHTFSLVIENPHGLVEFSNGQSEFSETVYVTGPAPNDTPWILVGVALFLFVVFLWLTVLSARRRGRKR